MWAFVLPLAFLALSLVCVQAASVQNADGGNLELLILHNNDMHARFDQTDKFSGPCKTGTNCYGGFARVAHVIREARTNETNGGPKVLYLNAGDTYQGTPWYTLYKWNITYMMLNAIQPDAMSLGNHEFDDGVAGLVPFLKHVEFPVLACNLDLGKEPDLKSQTQLKNSTIFEKGGVKIGVIGYLTPETKTLSAKTNVEYIDEVVAINAEAKRLKDQGVNILIALGHSGFDMDRKIAAEVPDIDLVIGGHSNTFLWNGSKPDVEQPEGLYPTVIKQKETSKEVPVVQAYAFTKYLGRLHMVFDKNGDLISFDGQPILLDESVTREKDVQDLVEVYRPGVTKLKETVVAKTAVFLDGSCRLQECNLGNLVADSMVRAYTIRNNGSNNNWSDAAIAFVSGGGIRSSIDAKANGGNITMEDLMTILPFGNDLVVVEYKGQTVLEALEHSIKRYNGVRGNGEFLQMSGVRVTYDISAKPGSRVLNTEVHCTKCEYPKYETLEPESTYKVIINAYLSEGGDGYEMLKTKAISSNSVGVGDLEAAEDYFKQKSPISQGIEGRITLMNPSSAISRMANGLAIILALIARYFV